jgi:hypothetical protein
MNKQERKLKGLSKFKKRLKNYGYNLEDINKPNYNLYCFKTTGKPCSCNICKKPRYKRNKKKIYE